VVGTQVPAASRSSTRIAVMPAPAGAAAQLSPAGVVIRKVTAPLGSTSNTIGSIAVTWPGRTSTPRRMIGPSRVPPPLTVIRRS
jgi:hypothetical protein